MTLAKTVRAPFDAHGSLMHYANPERRDDDGYSAYKAHEWRDTTTIYLAQLTFVRVIRGRSAAYFTWHDELGREYPMFMTDIAEFLRSDHVTMAKGVLVPPPLRVRKRGMNYGIAIDTPPAPLVT